MPSKCKDSEVFTVGTLSIGILQILLQQIGKPYLSKALHSTDTHQNSTKDILVGLIYFHNSGYFKHFIIILKIKLSNAEYR